MESCSGEGIIIKGIGGFYYVKIDNEIYECRARGLFRKKKITPLVGDRVKIDISENKTGYVQEILKRKTELFRPPVANVEKVIIVFAAQNPNPNLWLIDRFILLAESQNLDVVICITKIDLAEEDVLNEMIEVYEKTGYCYIFDSLAQKLFDYFYYL